MATLQRRHLAAVGEYRDKQKAQVAKIPAFALVLEKGPKSYWCGSMDRKFRDSHY